MQKNMIKNIYPLTTLQEGILFHSLNRGEETPYFEQIIVDIRGVFDVTLFEESWRQLVQRHDIFRTVFVHKNTPSPKQVVLKSWSVDFQHKDISSIEDKEHYVANFVKEDKQTYFDLSKKPPLRVRTFKIDKKNYKVIMDFHHIYIDGWSMAIVFSELLTLYDGLREGKSIELPPIKPYSHYVKWFKQQDQNKTKKFWNDYLKDYTKPALLPENSNVREYVHNKKTFIINQEKTNQLNTLVEENSLTLNILIQSIWAIILGALNHKKDVVFGATVSGRIDEIIGVEDMVGLFINAIPVRIKFSEKESLIDVCKRVMQESIEAKKHHHYSLADIQNATPLKDKLINQLIVFDNYPMSVEKSEEREYEIEIEDVYNQTNYNFDITISASNTINIMLKYNSSLYSRELINLIEESFIKLIDFMIKTPTHSIEQIDLTSIVNLKEKKSYNLFVTSSFTAELIETGLEAWSEKFDISLDTEFGEYNQVVQHLIDTNSPLFRKNGVNIILIRFEDILRFSNLKNSSDKLKIIKDNVNQILTLLESRSFDIPTFIPIFKPKQNSLFEELTSLYEKFFQKIKVLKNIYPIDFRELESLYQVEKVFDEKADSMGHIPFSDAYFFAMGSFLFRKIYAYHNPHFKVLALDCDNTLWGGVVGEDGASGIDISGGYLELQKFVVEKQKEGFLIVLNSKNNESDVWEVFEKNNNMLLKKKHIVHSKINWQPKSQNLKEMAEELNLGLNSFVFLDDNPLECSEIIKNAPEVLALPLPKNPDSFKLFLEHIWAMDKLKVTEEDKQRTQMYKAETERSQSSQKLSMDDFLASLELEIYMNRMFDSQLPRTSQLTNRTNQFNVSTIRRSENDIKMLLENQNYLCWTINVKDKFGDYGLVSVVISEIKGEVLFIDTFLMSCRVLGRGVEKTILAGLKRYASNHGLIKLEIDFYPTQKNRPALDFIENYHFKVDKVLKEKTTYSLMVEELPKQASFVTFHFDKDASIFESQEANPKENIQIQNSEEKVELVEGTVFQNSFTFDFLETIERGQVEQLVHRKFYEPLKFHKASDTVNLNKMIETRVIQTEFITPRTHKETALADIYKELLNLQKVGIKDCFFELGGHSLMATRLLSRIHYDFRIELEIQDVFSNPTIEKLVQVMEKKNTKAFLGIKPVPKASHYATSNAQRRIWVMDKMHGEMSAYNMFGAIEFEAPIKSELLKKSMRQLIARHEILRTNFKEIQSEVRQVIHDHGEEQVELVTLSEESIDVYMQQEAKRVFDLETDALIYIKLINHTILFINMHHIISDGWSIGVIIKELSTLYNAFLKQTTPQLDSLEIQYKEYTYWQNTLLDDKKYLQANQNYWHTLLEEHQRLEFPTDFVRGETQSFEGETIMHTFASHLNDKIKKLSQDTTLFITLLTLINILLSRYTNQEDILIGTPIANRRHQDFFNQIGFYVNTLALRNQLDSGKSFKENLLQIEKNTLNAYEHQSYPFDKLVDELNLEREINQNPLFNIMIILQNNEEVKLDLGGIAFKQRKIKADIAKFDITFNFIEEESNLHLQLQYNQTLFKRTTIIRLLANFETLIENIRVDSPLDKIEMLSNVELQLLNSFNNTTKAYPSTTLIEMFEEQVNKTPHNTALVCGNKVFSYQELNQKANRVGAYLRYNCAIKTEEIVPIIVERSEWMIVALLGVLKAGGAYLPIDIEYPKERIEYMLQETNALLIVCDKALEKEAILYANDSNIQTLCIETLPSDTKKMPNLPHLTTPEHLAYIIYTSGSTGQPKGVMIEHRSIVNTIRYDIKAFGIEENDRLLQFASFAFDGSIPEIFAILLSGATLVIANKAQVVNNFAGLVEKNAISVVKTTPTFLNSVQKIKGLKKLITGGDRVVVTDALEYAKETTYINSYGPTEAAVNVTTYTINPHQYYISIPIGKAIDNTQIYILNKANQQVPLGGIGELCIGGENLARGYLGQETLTQEKFIHHPYLGRIYKTGDMAKYLEDGNIEYYGRIDEQVKIRGFRVELGDIHNAIEDFPLIEKSLIIAKNLTVQDKVLIAYLVVKSDNRKGLIDNVKIYLKNKLPSYMIPTYFVLLDSLPLTSNGKIDKKALPNPKDIQKTTTYYSPITITQRELAKIFSNVLQQEKVGIKENFFDIGGDSLKAIKIITTINQHFHKQFNLTEIFKRQTIEELALWIEQQKDEEKKQPYTLYNQHNKKQLIIFPSLLHIADNIFVSQLAEELHEYKIYALDYIEADTIVAYSNIISKIGGTFSFLGYSTGGILAFETIKVLQQNNLVKPERLILLDSWKNETLNTIDKSRQRGYVELLQEYGLLSYHSKLKNYIKKLNHNKTLDSIDVPIDLIKAEYEESILKGRSQNWDINTTFFRTYQGIGNHETMVKGKNFKENILIINKCLEVEYDELF